jgi:hypothetical protein
MESRTQRLMFRIAECAAIINELNEVDWFNRFIEKRINCCFNLFYEIVRSCFERHVLAALTYAEIYGGW